MELERIGRKEKHPEKSPQTWNARNPAAAELGVRQHSFREMIDNSVFIG
jgi:hypothetical protein